ncbi:DUF1488 domain-containing protein [Mesorhizobium sp. IMUNJ 23232]|uniref:DUF1488 domain-containing protein n=1 Tax=Mesorhizobium sp. IMUNJ 23232 TaxID=3376064 RepID=UPI00379F8D36
MTLGFPNPSRSFDDERNAIRFIGHDGMFEVRFFIEAAALAKTGLKPHATKVSEADYLAAFDSARGSIQDVARKAYAHGHQTSYVLTAADFRR